MQIEEGVENLGRDPIAGDKEYFMPRKVAAAETSASPLVDESLTPVSKAEALAMQLAARQKEIDEQARRIARLEKELAFRDSQIAKADQVNRALDGERIGLAHELATARHEYTALQARFEALEKDYSKQERDYSKQVSLAAAARCENDDLRASVEALKKNYATVEYEVGALRASTSWRLTAPLRAARYLFNSPRRALAELRQGPSPSPLNLELPATAVADPVLTEPVDDKGYDDDLVTPVLSAPSPPPKPRLPGLEGVGEADEARVRAAFDAAWYLAEHPDVAASGFDPFEHYMLFGWKEGRDPSKYFSTSYYLSHSPDLARANINPFLHWIFHGQREHRQPLPFRRRLALIEYAPRVSVIVPNYNHAPFLEQRIDSILNQTYPNLDLVILDDCSIDDSREVIERYCRLHPQRVRAIFNDTNAGNVFRQWRKGIENSSGDLVWICESDDFCEPDFLAKMVPYFADRSVQIAFGRIQFSDRDGNFQAGLDGYREGAEAGIWDQPLVRPAQKWFANGFGVNNVIANVGGCVWRRQQLSDAVWREAERYTILGDWFLYAQVAAGGQIAYDPGAVAYFRQHGGNTSVTGFVRPAYYSEHEWLMLELRRRWDVPAETVERFHEKVAWQYERHDLEPKLGPLENLLDRRRLMSMRREQPHILIAMLGFQPGGGEIFPINLANALHAAGWTVSLMALDMGDVNDDLLASVHPGISVYDSEYVAEYGADRFLADTGVSVIHSHMISVESFFFERCRLATRIPYLVSLHGSYDTGDLSAQRLMTFALGVSHWVYTADKNLAPFHDLPLSERLFTKLANAMPEDPLPFPKSRAELGIAEDAIVFTLVARGIKRKGWRAAIDAFIRLRQHNPERPMHLLLCGDGEEKERHYAEHGADPDITFLGFQARIHGLYRLSDVAVVPSRFAGESYPLCIIQALQTGTPVIGTRVGEIATMIAPEGSLPGGILIDAVRDTEAFTISLSQAMEAMLSAGRRRKFARAAKKLGASYDMGRIAEEYGALYRDLINSANRRLMTE